MDIEGTSIRDQVEATRRVFDALMDGEAGQAAEQAEHAGATGSPCASGNYYIDDPVESRKLGELLERIIHLRSTTGNDRVLVAACGDGLETVLLARAGFVVTAFDLSPNGVVQTARRLAAEDLSAELYVDDLTDLTTDRYRSDYVGVVFAQAAPFLPVTDASDSLLAGCVGELASRGLVFYFSTTSYRTPVYEREWQLRGRSYGTTLLYAHDLPLKAVGMAGLTVVSTEHYESGQGPDDYLNDYLLAVRPGLDGRSETDVGYRGYGPGSVFRWSGRAG